MLSVPAADVTSVSGENKRIRPLSDLLRRCRSVNSKKGVIARALVHDSKRSFWAMADQGVVSLGNFGVSILLAACFERKHDLSDFGSYWILMELMLFLNGIQAALVVYPLSVRGPVADEARLGRMASMSMLLTMLLWPLMGASVVATAVIAEIPISVGLWAAAALALWQVQETLRRALISHLKFRHTLLGDSISYLGQILSVGILAWTGQLTLVGTFAAMALTSGVAVLVQGVQVGLHDISWREMREYARDCWELGRWVLYGNLSRFFTGPLFNWNLAFWLGKDLLAVTYAVSNLLRLTNPLMFAISTLIMPNATRANKEAGIGAARHEMHRFALLGGLMLAPYLGMLLLAPRFSIALAYWDWHSPYLQYANALRIATISSALFYMGTVLSALLNSVERTRDTFVAQAAYAATAVLIVLPMTALFGLMGAFTGGFFSAAALTGVCAYYVSKLGREPAIVPLEALDSLHARSAA
jgi:O-antigen/teichoic acid export membrane protein